MSLIEDLTKNTAENQVHSYIFADHFVYQHSELTSFFKEVKARLGDEGSYSRLAQRCGLKSRTEAKKIFLGEKGISKLALEQFALSLGLGVSAIEYLELLRVFEVATDPEKVWALGQKILKLRREFIEADRMDLNESQLCLLENWWTIPLLHYFDLRGQPHDVHSIQRAFRSKVSLVEIEESIEALIHHKLLRRETGLRFARSTHTNVWLDAIPNPLVKRFHQMMILQAHSAVTDIARENRYVISTTLPVKKANIEALRERVKVFMEEMNSLYSTSEAEEVYQLNIQLFSVLNPPE